MYELFVLGNLMTVPMHGYLLHSILKSALGPVRQISWGTLYPMIRRMEKVGFIRQRTDIEQEGGRPRKVYELTAAGRERFRGLMAEPLEYNLETEITFQFKLSYFGYVTKDDQLTCLRQYFEYIEFIREHMHDAEEEVRSNARIPEKKRVQLLRVFDHRKHVMAADAKWVEAEVARINGVNDETETRK